MCILAAFIGCALYMCRNFWITLYLNVSLEKYCATSISPKLIHVSLHPRETLDCDDETLVEEYFYVAPKSQL